MLKYSTVSCGINGTVGKGFQSITAVIWVGLSLLQISLVDVDSLYTGWAESMAGMPWPPPFLPASSPWTSSRMGIQCLPSQEACAIVHSLCPTCCCWSTFSGEARLCPHDGSRGCRNCLALQETAPNWQQDAVPRIYRNTQQPNLPNLALV